MSHFDFETVAKYDPYMAKNPTCWFQEDIADDDDRERRSAMEKDLKVRARQSATTIRGSGLPLEHGNTSELGNTHVSVANELVVSIGRDKKVRVEDDQGTIASATIDLQSGSSRGREGGGGQRSEREPLESPSRLFVDPLGRHIIVTFPNTTGRYIHLRASGKPLKHDLTFNLSSQQVGVNKTSVTAAFSRIGGLFESEDERKVETAAKVLVESVCWDRANKFENTSGTVLLGTKTSGNVISARFDAGGMQNPKTIFAFPDNMKIAGSGGSGGLGGTSSQSSNQERYPPITAIAIDQPSDRTAQKLTVILIAVQDKLFYFHGTGPVETVLSSYSNYQVLPNYRQILLDNPLANAHSIVTKGSSSSSSSTTTSDGSPTAAVGGNTKQMNDTCVCHPTLNLDYVLPQGSYGSRQTPVPGTRGNLLVFNWSYGSVLCQGYINSQLDSAPTLADVETYYKKTNSNKNKARHGGQSPAPNAIVGSGPPQGSRRAGGALLHHYDEKDHQLDDDTPQLSMNSTPCVLIVTNEMNLSHLLSMEPTVGEKALHVSTDVARGPLKKIVQINATPLFVSVTTDEKTVILALSAGLRWTHATSVLQGGEHQQGVVAGGTREQIQRREQIGLPGLRNVDVKNRTIYETPAGQFKLRKEGQIAVGTSFDLKKRKFAVYNPEEVDYLGDFKIGPGQVPLWVAAGERVFRETSGEDVQVSGGQLPARDYFSIARGMAGKNKRLSAMIDQSLSRALWKAKHHSEAAGAYSRCVKTIGIDAMIVQLSSLPTTTQPLQVFVRNRLNDYLSRKVHVDEYVVELAALSCLHIHLLVDQCNRDELERLAMDREAEEEATGGLAAPHVPHMGNIHTFFNSFGPEHHKTVRHGISKRTVDEDGNAVIRQQSFGGTILEENLEADLEEDEDRQDREGSPGSEGNSPSRNRSGAGAGGNSDKLEVVDRFGASQAFLNQVAQLRRAEQAGILGMTIDDFAPDSGQSAIGGGDFGGDLGGDGGFSTRAGSLRMNENDERDVVRGPVEEIDHVLQKYNDHVQWEAIKKGVLSIGNQQQINTVCLTQRKLEEVLESHILRNCYYDAVNLLLNECATPQALDLWKRYSYVLIRRYPVKLIRQGWIALGRDIGLSAADVLAPLCYYRNQDNEPQYINASTGKGEGDPIPDHMGIEFLTHSVEDEGDSDESVHNLLVLFLCRQPLDTTKGGTGDENIVRFLQSSRYYDKLFAVRVCAKHKRYHALSELYYLLGESDLAIQTALHSVPQGKGVDVAKTMVKRVGEDYITFESLTREDSLAEARKLRVLLWRQIISFVAKREGGSRNALLLVGESHDEVNVSDVLPHFNDEVMIVEFKDELQSNVRKFQEHMKGVVDSIVKAEQTATQLSEDFHYAKRSAAKIPSGKKCEYCNQTALSRNMVVFPTCGHCFHRKCYNAIMLEVAVAADDMSGDLGGMSSFGLGGGEDHEHCPLCSPGYIKQVLASPLQSTSLSTALKL